MSVPSIFSLTTKRALITGSTSGIGLAIALEMARAGADVVVSSNVAGDCARIAAEVAVETGVRTLALACDVTKSEEIAALYQEIERAWGGLDILVCNAGANLHEGSLADISDEALAAMFDMNVTSALRLIRLVAPGMRARRDGVILITSSLSGLRGNRRIGGYGISKAANAQLARNLAVEWGVDNVRVNAISPGLIATPFAGPILTDDKYLPVRLARTPLGRVGKPEEIGGTAVWLASAAGAFVTGQNILVDGGTLISD
jgi:NAD(P)-dependent dehydrogenase (short-subunit alcohol dehydrogenase family)